jgi:hypothetical protein
MRGQCVLHEDSQMLLIIWSLMRAGYLPGPGRVVDVRLKESKADG